MSKKKSLRIAGYIGLLLIVLISIVLVRTYSRPSRQLTNVSLAGPEIPSAADSILSEAIQIPTISYDDRERIDTLQFLRLRKLLEHRFPLVHQHMQVEIINRFSLIFTWKGSSPQLKPVLCLAHQDVVPVEPGTEQMWEEEPFSGHMSHGFIWGRGALDDKVSLIGLLQAAEMMIQEGFQPSRTLMFAFGHDEEISGKDGAMAIARHLENQQIKAEFILDEGLVITRGIVPGMSEPVALIGTAEKGYLTLRFSIATEGGHSAMPHQVTAAGNLMTGLTKLQERGFKMKITQPVQEFMEYLGPELPFVLRMAFANTWLFKPLIIKEYSKIPSGRAIMQTTHATTVLRAGDKENVIPVLAEAWVNFRILPGTTSAEILENVRQTMADTLIRIEPWGLVTEATPPASISSPGFLHIQRSVATVFPQTHLAPSLVTVTTDSRHYSAISENIFKFLPVEFTSADLKRIHGPNERISSAAFHKAILFYYFLLKTSSSG